MVEEEKANELSNWTPCCTNAGEIVNELRRLLHIARNERDKFEVAYRKEADTRVKERQDLMGYHDCFRDNKRFGDLRNEYLETGREQVRREMKDEVLRVRNQRNEELELALAAAENHSAALRAEHGRSQIFAFALTWIIKRSASVLSSDAKWPEFVNPSKKAALTQIQSLAEETLNGIEPEVIKAMRSANDELIKMLNDISKMCEERAPFASWNTAMGKFIRELQTRVATARSGRNEAPVPSADDRRVRQQIIELETKYAEASSKLDALEKVIGHEKTVRRELRTEKEECEKALAMAEYALKSFDFQRSLLKDVLAELLPGTIYSRIQGYLVATEKPTEAYIDGLRSVARTITEIPYVPDLPADHPILVRLTMGEVRRAQNLLTTSMEEPMKEEG